MFDKIEVEDLLRAAALAGVGMWETVTAALATLCKELLSESVGLSVAGLSHTPVAAFVVIVLAVVASNGCAANWISFVHTFDVLHAMFPTQRLH